jgi:hypothetical protein
MLNVKTVDVSKTISYDFGTIWQMKFVCKFLMNAFVALLVQFNLEYMSINVR